MTAFLVTGTGTEVGKTYVSARLLAALRMTGIDVGAMKPFESGCQRDASGTLQPADALALLEGAGSLDPLDRVCPHRFEQAVSPATAAEWAGVVPDLQRLDEDFHWLREKHAYLLIEGAGGFLSPLTSSITVADLALRWGLPVLVVVKNTLGCLNHALLTLEAIKGRGLFCLGVIFNHLPPAAPFVDDASTPDNPERLARLLADSGVPVLGQVPCEFHLVPQMPHDPLFTPLADLLLQRIDQR